MKNAHRWIAKRSGPTITITGFDDAGAPLRIAGVRAIEAKELWPIAIDSDGQHWWLLPENYDQIRSAIAATAGSPSELVGFLGEDDEVETSISYCIACNATFVDDDLVLADESGGFIHASCCGPERESYVNAGGEPLGPNDPIPTPFRYGDLGHRMKAEA